MECLILAAGYATRLYPLTENTPKPLLDVCGKTILDHLVDDIASSGEVSRFIVVSNHKFYENFKKWAEGKPQNIEVLDDGTDTNETRLGAVADIWFAVEKLGVSDDLMVIAGDNVLDFSLLRFIEFFRKSGTTSVMRYYENDEKRLKRGGVLTVDDDGKIISMEEKPENPKSHWLCPPFYIYKKEDVPLVRVGLDSGCGKDAPGSFIAWLCGERCVSTFEMPGKRYDIGNLDSYNEVQRTYKGITK